MLFDLAPKSSRRDLYDFEDQLEELNRLYRDARIIAVVGIRRIGKTSLILTFLNEYKIQHIYVDCRKAALSRYGASFRGFAEELSEAITKFLERNKDLTGSIRNILSSVKGVELNLPFTRVYLKWGRKDRVNVAELLEGFNALAEDEGIRLAVVFDELQELPQIGVDVPRLLAYAYDHLRNIVIIVSGSQVGLLYDALKLTDPQSPLYGRLIAEVKVPKLSRGSAVDFLRRGFEEYGIQVGDDVIEGAVDSFDGVVGWLTYFGWSYIHGMRDLAAIIDMAARQEAEEIRRFLAKTRNERRYREVLRAIAQGHLRWSEIKEAVEVEEGVEVDDKNFNEILQRLVKAGFIEKKNGLYMAVDKVTTVAIQRYL